jgi:hypothetical protein
MPLKTMTSTEHREACAWYVLYPLDAYAMGPYRYPEPVTADVVIEQALNQFGERPYEVWPDGPCEEVEEYDIQLDILE